MTTSLSVERVTTTDRPLTIGLPPLPHAIVRRLPRAIARLPLRQSGGSHVRWLAAGFPPLWLSVDLTLRGDRSGRQRQVRLRGERHQGTGSHDNLHSRRCLGSLARGRLASVQHPILACSTPPHHTARVAGCLFRGEEGAWEGRRRGQKRMRMSWVIRSAMLEN